MSYILPGINVGLFIPILQRFLLRGEIQPKFRALCDSEVPVTGELFGNDDEFRHSLQESDLAAKITAKPSQNYMYADNSQQRRFHSKNFRGE